MYFKTKDHLIPWCLVILIMDLQVRANYWTTSLTLMILVLLPLGCNTDNTIHAIENVCPESRGVLINRTVSVNPSYDGGTAGHWFTLARELVNSVKKENLPYGMYMYMKY